MALSYLEIEYQLVAYEPASRFIVEDKYIPGDSIHRVTSNCFLPKTREFYTSYDLDISLVIRKETHEKTLYDWTDMEFVGQH